MLGGMRERRIPETFCSFVFGTRVGSRINNLTLYSSLKSVSPSQEIIPADAHRHDLISGAT